VYPNPFPDHLIFFLPDDNTTAIQLELRDLYGRVVAGETVTGRQYQFRWVPHEYIAAGTYFLQITRGAKIQVTQVIKI
jgi:hypothetical protein